MQGEDVGGRPDALVGVELLDLLLAQALDVEGEARDEMLQPLLGLRRADETAGAAAHDAAAGFVAVGLAHGVATADGANLGELVGRGLLGTLVEHRADDLRDDVTGALDDDGVADAHVLAADLVFVVQRGVGDDDAADVDRLEPCDGRERAGAANLDFNAAQDCGRLLGGELVGDGPTRRARDEAKAVLQIEAIDLVDDAVDVVAELGALLTDAVVVGDHRLGRCDGLHQRVDGQAPTAEGGDDAGLRIGRQLADLTPGVGEKLQRARRGNAGVKLAQRAGGSVARVGEYLGAGGGLRFVQLREVGVAVVDLAAHFHDRGHVLALQLVRD